jgi:hypothetical protein
MVLFLFVVGVEGKTAGNGRGYDGGGMRTRFSGQGTYLICTLMWLTCKQ